MSDRGSSDAPGSVLMVTGPPGSGKSTVAPLVADRLGPPAACIEADWFWTTIRSDFIDPWESDSDQQNRTVLRSVVSAAAEMVLGGYHVVIDGVIGPWHLATAVSVLEALGIDLHYVVLRPGLAACLARAEQRSLEPPRVPGHPALTASGPIRHMWDQFSDLGTFEAHVIDTTEHSPAGTVDLILQRRANRGLRVSG